MKTMTQQNQKGFTLIELMIVVAIIGILAAVALPAYQDYTKRAHVSEGITLAGSAKSAVTEYYVSQSDWPADNTTAGLPTGTDITGNAVTSVTVSKTGTSPSIITIVYNSKVEDTKTIVLTPTLGSNNGSIKWTCTAGTVNDKYKPANCR